MVSKYGYEYNYILGGMEIKEKFDTIGFSMEMKMIFSMQMCK